MRRAGQLWPRIVSFANLLAAARRAALGKHHVRSAAAYLERLEPEVLALERELRDGTWRPGAAFAFEIHDPKTRTITAAPFRDRVVHHALMDVLAPVFERRMLHESFACRAGKGTHAALRHARRQVRRFDWFLKLDVRRCFPSIRHEVVMGTVSRVVKDRPVLDLCRRILAGHAGDPPGVGIPIGNLTSQWFANLVLDRLDHHVKEVLRAPGYVRYMDDFVLFADDKAALRQAQAVVWDFLDAELRLALKDEATILAPAEQGLPFLGFRIHRGLTRLRPENASRTRRRLWRRHRQFANGRIDEATLAASVRSMAAHLEHGTTRAWRRRAFSISGFGSQEPRTA